MISSRMLVRLGFLYVDDVLVAEDIKNRRFTPESPNYGTSAVDDLLKIVRQALSTRREGTLADVAAWHAKAVAIAGALAPLDIALPDRDHSIWRLAQAVVRATEGSPRDAAAACRKCIGCFEHRGAFPDEAETAAREAAAERQRKIAAELFSQFGEELGKKCTQIPWV